MTDTWPGVLKQDTDLDETVEAVTSRATILVVEDEQDLRSTVAEVLQLDGYHVETAAHGAEALALLDEGLRIVGGLALAVSAVALSVYVWSRDDRLVVSVAGESDIELAADDDIDDDLLDRLRTAIDSDNPAPAATSSDFGETAVESENDDPLGENLDFGDGGSATGQAVGEPLDPEPTSSASVDEAVGGSEPPEPSPVDEAAVENVLDAMDDDDGDTESDAEATTDDGTLDLTDPKDL